MKYFFYIIILFFGSEGKSQIYNIEKTELGVYYDSLRNNSLYEIDSTIFSSIKQGSSKKFKLIYTWEVWCKPCIKSLPKVLNFVNENKEIIDLFIIINENEEKWLRKTFKYFDKKGYPNLPIFVLNNREKKYWTNYHKFVKSFFKNHKNYGLSLLMLFDAENSSIYATNYYQDSEEKIKAINNQINCYQHSINRNSE